MNAAGNRGSRSPFDPYASDSSDSPSPLMKFLRSVDPPPSFLTPVKDEEDVIVMDGISVPNSNKGSGEVRLRLPLMPSNSLNCRFVSHYRETSHMCQFGSQCQFAHGKEELRHHRFSGKTKLKDRSPNQTAVLWDQAIQAHLHVALSSTETAKSRLPQQKRHSQCHHYHQSQLKKFLELARSRTLLYMLVSDWTPRTDGIEVCLPCVDKSSSEEDVGAYMENVLYGAKVKRRLPVFVGICSDS
ncbi:uncharacterized protein LOC121754110 isoform X1 [Salvia splendens]|nr:uncharacterized protein LOC121754110 isoform X1 [Salvia splendens]